MKRNFTHLMFPLFAIFIAISWVVGFILIPLRHVGIIHMASWINTAFFWGPYAVIALVMFVWLAWELRHDISTHDRKR